MAATHSQPLLHPPKNSSSHGKRICLILSIIAIASSAALVSFNLTKPTYPHVSVPHQMCQHADEPASCLAHVSEVAQGTTLQTKHHFSLLEAFLEETAAHVQKAIRATEAIKYRINEPRQPVALGVCEELLSSSVERVLDSIAALRTASMESHQDAHAWLSAVLTNHVTCLDGLEGSALSLMEVHLKDLISRAGTTLAMFVAITPPRSEYIEPLNGELPSWVTREDRKLLQLPATAIIPDIIVAKDGSGNFTTVKEAVAAAPIKNEKRFIIYVKNGTYDENVDISNENLMLVGDGMDSTIITGNLSYEDFNSTYRSATVGADGDGFIGQDIGFQNTAGPEKDQAVALRVRSDKSVINQCRIDAYQDTLYAFSLRQFYRDSYITGTVDFIFGNAAVVFQNCSIRPRKPRRGQENTITAQGREDPNQNTGTSIQDCNIKASSDLQPFIGEVKSYLGRPWKNYSRTMVMQSYIGSVIDPAGWLSWLGYVPSTLYYAEYMNSGPGAGTSHRVNWTGYHVIKNSTEAEPFTVAQLIQGGSWLPSTGVSFKEGL